MREVNWLDRLVEEYFRLLAGIVLLIGICLLLTSYQLPAGGLWRDLIRDLGIAFVVSFIVSFVIEYYSARRREADIRSGILDSILEKIVHPALWQEIKSDILTGIICDEWHLETVVARETVTSPNATSMQLIGAGTLTYKLTNQTARTQRTILRHELEGTIQGKEQTGDILPRFIQLNMAGATPNKIEEADLNKEKYRSGDRLSVPIEIPPFGTVEIAVKRREILPFPDVSVWHMTWVTLF